MTTHIEIDYEEIFDDLSKEDQEELLIDLLSKMQKNSILNIVENALTYSEKYAFINANESLAIEVLTDLCYSVKQ